MKTVAIVPIKSFSERVKGKNFRLVNGKPLYTYILTTLKSCNFDEVYVDTDSDEIKEFCRKLSYKVIDRLPELAENNANGNDLMLYHESIIDADIYFQLFCTAPLLTVETINDCISIMNSGEYDSVLTVEKIYSWFWFDNKPVNYDPHILPRSQDATPIIRETTGLYGIKRGSVLSEKCRVGKKPYLKEVSKDESIDLDNEIDFRWLSSVVSGK
jgi:CMP-N-acetylneuraminic acid synthetase